MIYRRPDTLGRISPGGSNSPAAAGAAHTISRHESKVAFDVRNVVPHWRRGPKPRP
jgi:hypothetical protein